MSEEQAQQLAYQMQMLENLFAELTQKENSIINIIREANTAMHTIKGVSTNSQSDSLVPLGLGAFMKTKVNSDEKIIMNIGSGVAIEKTHDEAVNYLESRERLLICQMMNLRQCIQDLPQLICIEKCAKEKKLSSKKILQ